MMLLSLETQDLQIILQSLKETGQTSLLGKLESETQILLKEIQNIQQETIDMAQGKKEEKPLKPSSFREFSLEQAREIFKLDKDKVNLFPEIEGIVASDWLKQSLSMAKRKPLHTEKERSEAIIYHVMTEIQNNNDFEFQIFSGEYLTIDKEKGLKGEFDFALVNDSKAEELTAPIFTLVEAKQADITKHWGQITAQMVGAREESQKKGLKLPAIFGCVTSGENWHFAKLENDFIYIDERPFSLYSELEKILGIFQFIVDVYKEDKNNSKNK